MENTEEALSNSGSENKNHMKEDHKVTFHGNYKQFLGLSLYNILLTVITLGIYYPWAKCAIRKYLWQETEIAGSRFEWHGTGAEMFRGFIKAYFILGGLLITLNFGPMFLPPEMVVWFVLGAYLFILLIIPLAIHGMARYRLSRTSLRGIHCGYRGSLKEFYGMTIKDFLLTIVTLGFYGAWLQTNIRTYVMKHSRYGDTTADFDGTGGQFFGLSIVQGLLSAITFYLYVPWAIVEFYKFYVGNTSLVQNDKSYYFETNAKGGQYFLVLIKAILLTVVTLGIAAPIASLMLHKYFVESVSLAGGFDFDEVKQTEKAYNDASGDDMGDILDLDI